MRAMEAETGWTFPSIKKQVDTLEAANIIVVNKEKSKRSITIDDDAHKVMKDLFLFSLKKELQSLMDQHQFIVKDYYLCS